MRKKILVSIVVILLFSVGNQINAQQIENTSTNIISEKDKIWFENNPDSLPIWLTSEELLKIDEIGKGKKIFEKAEIAQPQEVELDISEIQKLGYEPKFTIEQGVKKTIDWYKEKIVF